MKMLQLAAAFCGVIPMLAIAGTSTFQCISQDDEIRVVTITGSTMTVVNPNTPAIIFSKKSDTETRGDIVKYSNDAWEFFDKAGMGSLTNKTFGDEYGCMQTGSTE